MAIVLTDLEIDRLIEEPKLLSSDFYRAGGLRPKRGHRERDLSIAGRSGSEFVLIMRQSNLNPLDFSVILGYHLPKASRIFRLRRYNGRSHEHSNKLEGQKFYDFHIHYASERYQEAGFNEDAFAEPTNRYSDFITALDCLLLDCRCENASTDPKLF